jgi:hypothetical protein
MLISVIVILQDIKFEVCLRAVNSGGVVRRRMNSLEWLVIVK